MRTHVTRRGEARQQVCVHIRYGDEHRLFSSSGGRAVVEHMRMRVDQAREDRRLTQVNDLSSRRNLDLTVRTDFGDLLTLKHDHLSRQHLARLAVEQAAGTNYHRSRNWRALIDAAISPHARGCAHASPGSR